MELLIVTGLSGAGKSVAMHALEDIGYFCIDNIPAGLLPRLMDFAKQSETMLQKVAVGLDSRSARSSVCCSGNCRSRSSRPDRQKAQWNGQPRLPSR